MVQELEGFLPGEEADFTRVRLLLNLRREIPAFEYAVKALRLGGLRTHGSNNPKASIQERSFRPASEHCAVVSLLLYETSDFLGLEKRRRNIMVTSGLAHDTSKRLEIAMMGYINATPSDSKERSRNYFEQLLKDTTAASSIEEAKKITEGLAGLDFFASSSYFDEYVNTSFLKSAFANSPLNEEEKEEFLEVAGSDSFGTIPKMVARAAYFSKELPYLSPKAQNILNIAKAMDDHNKLPKIKGDEVDLMGATLLYVDDIVGMGPFLTKKGFKDKSRVVGLEARKASGLSHPLYSKLAEEARPFYEGNNLLEVSYGAAEIVEQVLVHRGKMKGLMDFELDSSKLPLLLIEKMYQRTHLDKTS